MKKTILILGIIIIIVLVSCIPEQVVLEQETEIVCDSPYMRFGQSCCLDKNSNKICDFDEIEEPVREESPVEVFPEKNETVPVMEKIYQTALQKIQKGYSYTFDNKKYIVRGEKIKIELPEYLKLEFNNELNIVNVIDTVYINKDSMITQGYCENTKYNTGYEISCRKLKDFPFALKFSDFYVKTPMDWLEEYRKKEPFFVKELSTPVNQAPATSIVFDEDDVFTTMWVNYYTALPLRVEVREKNNGVTALYNWYDYNYYISPDEVLH